MTEMHGECLCGAVSVQLSGHNPVLRACHCDMCRKHTSSMFISVGLGDADSAVKGPAKTFQSSQWAERGFCSDCGSTLWYGLLDDGPRNYAAGLFADLAQTEMTMEFFTDACPSGYALAGDQRKLTRDETIKMFTGEGDAT